MVVDNFQIIRDHLTFKSDFDRYIVHVIKRAKDDKGKTYGSNETNRLLKTFYITSLEYFDRKIPVIKDLCESNCARAYILPQVRDNSKCLKELLKIVVDAIDNPTIKPDHLVRTAFCGCHTSRDKKWILDLDIDNMVEYREDAYVVWSAESVFDLVKGCLVKCGKSELDAYMLPTRNGNCIVTSPFDLQSAFRECNMLFQGVTKKSIKDHFSGGALPKDVNGWLIKDGMALMYFNSVV